MSVVAAAFFTALACAAQGPSHVDGAAFDPHVVVGLNHRATDNLRGTNRLIHGQLEITVVKVDAPLTRSSLGAFVHEHLAEVESCARAENAPASATVHFSFTVQRGGGIATPHLSWDTDDASVRLATCVAERLPAWRFPDGVDGGAASLDAREVLFTVLDDPAQCAAFSLETASLGTLSVYIDGVSAGFTPLQRYALTSGPHTVQIEASAYNLYDTHSITIDCPNEVKVKWTEAPQPPIPAGTPPRAPLPPPPPDRAVHDGDVVEALIEHDGDFRTCGRIRRRSSAFALHLVADKSGTASAVGVGVDDGDGDPVRAFEARRAERGAPSAVKDDDAIRCITRVVATLRFAKREQPSPELHFLVNLDLP